MRTRLAAFATALFVLTFVAAPVSASPAPPPQQEPITATGDFGLCTMVGTITPVYTGGTRPSSYSNSIVITLTAGGAVASDSWTSTKLLDGWGTHLVNLLITSDTTCNPEPAVVP